MFDLVVIGTGAGLMVAEAAANLGLAVAIVEKGKFGGTCLTRGCIPSKMLVYPADMLREAERAHKVGLRYGKPEIDWPLISKRMWDRIDFSKEIEHNMIHMENVTVFKGEGYFTGPDSMKVRLNAGGEAEFSGKRFLIAAGAHSRITDIPGLEDAGYLTYETFFGDKYPEKPWESLIILGTGTIALEFAHIFAAFGTKVTVIGRNHRLLPNEDKDIADLVRLQMDDFGIRLLTGYDTLEVDKTNEGKRVIIKDKNSGEELSIEGEEILLAIGVIPESESLRLDLAGVETDHMNWIKADAQLQTSQPHIYALGDIIGGFMFRHKANYEAEILINNLFRPELPKRSADYRSIPWAIYTMPQVGHVGLTEEEVQAIGIKYHVGKYRYSYIAIGMAMGFEEGDVDNGMVKLLLDEEMHILGVHIAGFQAAALVQPFVYMMNSGNPLKNKEAGTILPMLRSMVIHPSLSELAAWSIENIDWTSPIDPKLNEHKKKEKQHD